MSRLSVKDVNKDLNMLLSCFGEQSRDVPSFGDIASKSVLVPLVSVCASIIGVVFFYASGLIRHPDTVDNYGIQLRLQRLLDCYSLQCATPT